MLPLCAIWLIYSSDYRKGHRVMVLEELRGWLSRVNGSGGGGLPRSGPPPCIQLKRASREGIVVPWLLW